MSVGLLLSNCNIESRPKTPACGAGGRLLIFRFCHSHLCRSCLHCFDRHPPSFRSTRRAADRRTFLIDDIKESWCAFPDFPAVWLHTASASVWYFYSSKSESPIHQATCCRTLSNPRSSMALPSISLPRPSLILMMPPPTSL